MNIFKSHFWYHKNQRNGILFLIIVIIILQITIVFDDSYSDDLENLKKPELLVFQNQLDSLRAIELKRKKTKIYSFNPNYISDFKANQLGMSIDEINRLLAFREKGDFINSVKEFQQVTKISDSLLHAISPYFRFPNWLVKRNQQLQTGSNQPLFRVSEKSDSKKIVSTNDLNLATASDFETISGVTKKLSKRIVKYRKKLKGFSIKEQLYEVWSIDKEIALQILATFKIINKPVFKKIDLNNASFKEVLANPYIDYDLCKKIVEYRDEVAELQSLEELKNIPNFPLEKYTKIALYLHVK